MKDDADQRAVHLHAAAAAFDEAKFPKAIEEEADARAGCANHFGERLLAHLGDDWYRRGLLAKVGEQQKKSSEPFFAGVEEVVHKVGFNAEVAGKQVGEKTLRELRILMQQVYHHGFLHADDGAEVLCGCGRHAERLAS